MRNVQFIRTFQHILSYTENKSCVIILIIGV